MLAGYPGSYALSYDVSDMNSCSLKHIIVATISICVLLTGFLGRAQSQEVPGVVSSTAPVISLIAVVARVSGNVDVTLTINAQGQVIETEIVSGHPLLQRPTKNAISLWRFVPIKGNAQRKVQITLVYPPLLHGEKDVIVKVLPYTLSFRVQLPEFSKPSEIVSHIPLGWSRGKERCRVHGEVLRKGKVEIIYGLTVFAPEFIEAMDRWFPNAKAVEYGGCVVMMCLGSAEIGECDLWR